MRHNQLLLATSLAAPRQRTDVVKMKTSLKRTGIAFLILCPVLFLLHSIAWADIFFWKTGTVAVVFGMPTTIFLWPLSLIPVKPGSPIDGPYFWLPLICLLLLAWSWLIQFLIHTLRRRKTERVPGPCEPAAGDPSARPSGPPRP
jgi:hypothetical protein